MSDSIDNVTPIDATAATEANLGGGNAGGNTAHDERLAALEAENAALKDQLLRTLAEQENLRRRTEREVKDAGVYAISKFARDVVSVGDNLRRALETLSAEARTTVSAGVTSLIDGVEMTERELIAGLERHGVRKIVPVGEKFDPNFHQAMFEIPDATVANGTVMQVVQAGYVIGDRVLRPALVGVSKGGPKPGAAAPKADEAHIDKSV